MIKFKSILLFCLLFVVADSFAQDPPKAPKEKKDKYLDLSFSMKSGFYDGPISVEISSPGAEIYYTLDGNEPNIYADKYRSVLELEKTTVLRVLAVRKADKKKSKLKTRTYFIGEPSSTFPVLSIAIPPEELFDPVDGLFMEGNTADSTWKKQDANFWSRSETDINFEFFESDGKSEFNSRTGFRLFGGMSRLFPQKSMVIVTRDKLGKKRISHKIFGKGAPKKYKFLVLRNSGSDFGRSHFRDGLMTSLLEDWDIERQHYRPSHVYINGKYWGIYNIREKINRYFVNSYHNIDKDSIDLIEHRISLKRGSKKHYLKMLDYIDKNDLKDPENYNKLHQYMEVDNFMDYQIAQIFFDNKDAGGNIKFWRPQTPTGRWRWIIYDTDWGMGLHDAKAYKQNSLLFHTEADGPSWPNPPWSTFILRNLLKNNQFKAKFVNRFADRLNTSFESQVVTDKIYEFKDHLIPELDRHLDRWNLSEKNFKAHVNRMLKFANKRPDYMRLHLQSFFKAGELVDVNIEAVPGGKVVLNNNVHIENQVFDGKYFQRYPIHVNAIPNFGYRFSHWIFDGKEIDTHDFDLALKSKKEVSLKAVFEKSEHVLAGKIIINEVSCNNSETGDWVEIYNASEEVVNLADWYFSDNKKYFKIPYFFMKPDSYVVLCEDSTVFKKTHTEVRNIVGNFGFGLNKRSETLGLYSDMGASIDSFSYVVPPMDTFFTLGLLLPHLNNSDSENWEVNIGPGSPDNPNPFYLESRIKSEQELWIRIGIGLGIFLIALFILKMRSKLQSA